MVLEAQSFEHLPHLLERSIIFFDSAISEVHLVDDPREGQILAVLRPFRLVE